MKDKKNRFGKAWEANCMSTPISALEFAFGYNKPKGMNKIDFIHQHRIRKTAETPKPKPKPENRFEINFAGQLLAGIVIKNNTPEIFGAMDGYGDPIDPAEITIVKK